MRLNMIQMEKNTSFLEQLEELAQTLSRESAPDWIRQVRKDGLRRFHEVGIPTTKDEEWKYTNISALAGPHYILAGQPDGRVPLAALKSCCSSADINIVFINGIFSKELSQLNVETGVDVLALPQALSAYPAVFQDIGHYYDPQKESAFVALNKALTRDGVYIGIKDKVIANRLIHIVHVSDAGGKPIITAPRTVIRIGKSAEATVLETHIAFADEAVYLTVPLTDIIVEDNATFFYVKAQKESLRAYHVGATRVWQQRDSTFNGFALDTGAAIARNNLDVVLNGAGATAFLNGLYSVYKDQLVDNHTSVDHREPNAISNQLYKGVLNDAGRAVFNGKIFVRPVAQLTNAYQLNKNLLLGKECQVSTKPQLEIFADDVKCTHGATIGQLNEDEIFYLQARGIPRAAATRLLTQGFVNDVLERVQRADVRQRLEQLLVPTLAALEQ